MRDKPHPAAQNALAHAAASPERLAALGIGHKAAHTTTKEAQVLGLEEGYAKALGHYKKSERAQAHAICTQILAQYSDYNPARQMKLAIECQLPGVTPFTNMVLYEKAHFEVGDYSYGVPIVQLDRPKDPPVKLYIGRFCSFASEVRIFLGSEHAYDSFTTYPFGAPNFLLLFGGPEVLPDPLRTKGDVRIGNDVYVGYGAYILSGVTVGDGAVIGAGAVVTKDVPPFAVVAGNPARVIRYRFDEATIALLMELRWWDWPLSKLRPHLKTICSSDRAALEQLVRQERNGAPQASPASPPG